jgi:hypothetical protein
VPPSLKKALENCIWLHLALLFYRPSTNEATHSMHVLPSLFLVYAMLCAHIMVYAGWLAYSQHDYFVYRTTSTAWSHHGIADMHRL